MQQANVTGLRMMHKTFLIFLGAIAGAGLALLATQPHAMYLGSSAKAASADTYRLRTRAEYERIERLYRGTEQASSARQLLRRFDEETKQK